ASAHEMARIARDASGRASEPTYWSAATLVEAALVLGEDDRAAALLSEARALADADADHGMLATTLRQLELVCALRGVDASLLAPLRPPAVAFFSGHRAGRLAASAEPEIAARIAEIVAARGIGYGFGALASGADILFAEALIAHGAELHVVLPLPAESFR